MSDMKDLVVIPTLSSTFSTIQWSSGMKGDGRRWSKSTNFQL